MVVCEECQNGPVEICLTDAQLQKASQLAAVENGCQVYVRGIAYGLVAVRHYVATEGVGGGYRTSLLSAAGEVVYAQGMGV